MNTQAIFFSFDMFGSPGTASGVHLLADEIREILADNRRETVPTRADAYSTDLRLREIDFPNLASLEKWRERGRKLARPVFQSGEFLLWFSGNHLGTLPLYDELSLATDKVVVLQFDAHLDIHHFRDCSSELSHGNFLRHCAGPLPPLINLGHRDLLLPRDTISEYFQSAFSVVDLFRDSQAVLCSVQSQLSKADRVFVDIDCDVLDPVFFPAVSQPVPFGLTPDRLLGLLEAIWSDRVAGIWFSEFDPARDRDDRSLSTLVWLVEHLLLKRHEGNRSPER